MNSRSSELTSGMLFPLHRPSTVAGMPERCSPARIRFAALMRVLACSAPFRQISTRDGRLRREHLSDSDSYLWSTKKTVDSAGLLMEVGDNSSKWISNQVRLFRPVSLVHLHLASIRRAQA